MNKKLATRRFLSGKGGNVGPIFALMVFPMVAMIGAAIDFSRALTAQVSLQQATDAAVVAGARIPATANQNRTAAAESMFNVAVQERGLANVTKTVQATNAKVNVNATYNHPTVTLSAFGINNIKVEARSSGQSQIENGGVACMLSLNPTTSDGLHLQGINKTSAKNCWTWINSTSATSINAVGASAGTAQGFCTAGGVTGAEHFTPAPFTGCEAMEDPFYSKFASSYPDDNCTTGGVSFNNGTHAMLPGVYCGNVILKPQANVTMAPGTYVIVGGYLEVQAGSSLTGNGVTIFFRGSNTRMSVKGGGNVDLKAPAIGPWAGFVLVDRRLSSFGEIRETEINGGGTVKIEGVAYVPQWRFNVGGNGDMNQTSKYFAIVADHFYMEGNGKLFINSDAVAAGLPDLMPKIKSGPTLLE